MRRAILKAQGKKKKYLARINKLKKDEDSDGSLSSDDEAEVSDNFIGDLIDNKYLVIKYLGRGTFAKVWMVYEIFEKKYFALKLFDSTSNDEFTRENKYLKLLNKSENYIILNYYGSVIVNKNNTNLNGIILELCGGSIDYFIREEFDDYITIDIIKSIIKKLLIGLQHMHQHGIVHTDLKLDNILIGNYNNKITNYIKNIDSLEINNFYNQTLESNTPKEFYLLDKNKRKFVKRRLKTQTLKKTVKHFREKLIDINSSSLVKLEELDKKNKTDNEENNEEKDDNEIDEKEYSDLSEFTIKLIDFGNSEPIGKMEQDEILCRSYRPPENIIGNYYDEKSDIWVVGCLLYELFNGNYLFDLSQYEKDISKDRKHILEMYNVLGKMPRDMALDCEFSEDIFDSKGRVIKNKNINPRNIQEELRNRIDISEEDMKDIEFILLKMLDYDPKTRPSASELLSYSWFV